MTNTAKQSKINARLQGLIDTEIATIDEAIETAVNSNKFECEVSSSPMTQTTDEYLPIEEAQAHCRMDIWSLELDENNGEGYREDDILTFADVTSDIPVLIKVLDVDEIGNPINFEIVQEGIYDEIVTSSAFKYYDDSNFLDVTKDYGEDKDLRLNRDGTYDVKLDGIWHRCLNVYTLETKPDPEFGEENAVFITNGKTYIKVKNKWQESNSYNSLPVVDSFGNEYDMIFGLLGHNYIKLTIDETPRWYDFGEVINVTSYPDPKDYNNGDVVYFTTHRVNSDYVYKLVKKNNIWYQIRNNTEYDFTGKTMEELSDFGSNGDIITSGNDTYVKKNGQWIKAASTYNSTLIYRYNDLGEEYDVFIQDGIYYCKINGIWNIITKVWNLNILDIGHGENAFNITWNINSIVIDNAGDGYNNATLVSVGGSESIASCTVENEKIASVEVLNKEKVYKYQPEVKFRMVGERISEKCYQIWKQKIVNPELADAMKQIIDHYEELRYSVSRLTNKSSGNTFKWKIRWY